MDGLFLYITIIILCLLFLPLCNRLCFNRPKPLPTVYTTVVAASRPQGPAPYPTNTSIMPQPLQQTPYPGYAQPPYPAAGYPNNYSAPYPPSAPGFVAPPSGAMCPPYPNQMLMPASQSNPPTYAEATNIYAKQEPYNPVFRQ